MKKQLTYRTSGTCARQIELTIDDEGRIEKAVFVGGCPGNTLGISQLIVGMKASEVAERMRGTRCGGKSTSCPDQLARAIDQALRED